MSEFSPIEWTDATWNPLLGCDKCSAGCQFCYAIRTAWRLMHNPNPTIAAAYAGLVEQRPDGSLNWTGKINLLPDRLLQPLGWKDAKRIFVNSQSDLFHPTVSKEFIDRVVVIMALCPRHTFQVLTKRPERMAEYFDDWDLPGRLSGAAGNMLDGDWIWNDGKRSRPTIERLIERLIGDVPDEVLPLPNVWLGVSAEDQRAADERIPHLIETPAAVRFLSCEPLLGPVDLTPFLYERIEGDRMKSFSAEPLSELHWVICGGESGQKARPMHPDWARSLRDQCAAAGVPFLFKQHGEWLPAKILDNGHFQVSTPQDHPGPRQPEFYHWKDRFPGDPNISARVGKKAAGRLLDGREHNEFPAAAVGVANA